MKYCGHNCGRLRGWGLCTACQNQESKRLLADSAYRIRENKDGTFSVVKWTNKYGGYELEMLTSTKIICEEWIASRV